MIDALLTYLRMGDGLALLEVLLEHALDERTFLDAAKRAIVDAVDNGDNLTAEEYVAGAWQVARLSTRADLTAWAHWCAGLAIVYYQAHEALEHFEAAAAFYSSNGREEEAGRVLINVSGLLADLGKLDRAEKIIERSAALLASSPTYSGWPTLYLNRAHLAGRRGMYNAMLDAARLGEQSARRFNQPANVQRALINQAYAALFLGDLILAAQVLTNAEQEAAILDVPDLSARIAVNQARLAIYRGALFDALRLLQRASTAFAAANNGIGQATIAIEQAMLFERLHMLREARHAATTAAIAFAADGLVTECVEARVLAARLALTQGRSTEAQQHLNAIATLRDNVGPTWQAIADSLGAHPQLHRTAAQRRSALVQADAAAERLQVDGTPVEWLDAALIAAALVTSKRQAAMRYRTIAAEAVQRQLPDVEYNALVALAARLPSADAILPLQRCITLMAIQRQQMPVEELKAQILSSNTLLVAQLIEALLAQGDEASAIATLLEARGGLWVDLSTPFTVEDDGGWIQARAALAYWQDERRTACTPEALEHCTRSVAEAERHLVSVARQQVRTRPLRTIPSLKTIQEHLPPDSLLIEYILGATKVWACVITADQPPRWSMLGIRSELNHVIERVGVALAALQHARNPEERREAAPRQRPLLDELLTTLGAYLIAPLELPNTRQIIIAPDEALFAVPWAALRVASDASQISYLGEVTQIALVPSGAVLPLTLSTTPLMSPLALGYAGDPPLAVEDELRAIVTACNDDMRSINPAHRRDLLGVTAPHFLHIAAHGHVNARTPLLSRIELVDGDLLLADVLQFNLHGTQLVTLSACETGVTPERGGVALAFSGAFLCAGAAAVLASGWLVDDSATILLMHFLYTALKSEMSLPQAVQVAQQSVRAHGYDHPYYWAAFQPLCRSVTTLTEMPNPLSNCLNN